MTLLPHIRAALLQFNEIYGSLRMVHVLREAGFDAGRRVACLMREDGLQARINGGFSAQQTAAITILWHTIIWHAPSHPRRLTQLGQRI